MDSFSDRLKNLLMKSGITQKRLAIETGIDQSLISDYVRGTVTPSIDKVKAIALFFGEDAYWLITGDDWRQRELFPLLLDLKKRMEQAAGAPAGENLIQNISGVEITSSSQVHIGHNIEASHQVAREVKSLIDLIELYSRDDSIREMVDGIMKMKDDDRRQVLRVIRGFLSG